MKISAGAPLSICLASCGLAASETTTCLPVSFSYWSSIASSAFLRLAAAKNRTSFACAAAGPAASHSAATRERKIRARDRTAICLYSMEYSERARGGSDHAIAAANANDLAGDPAAMLRGEQRHQWRDVLRLAKPAQRVEPDEFVAVGLDPVAVMRGLDEAQRDHIGGDTGSAHLSGERLRQPDHPGARRSDDREAGLADPRRVADQADDAAAAAFLEVCPRLVTRMDRAVEAGVDLPPPIFRGRLGEALALGDPSIVDEDVEPTEFGD